MLPLHFKASSRHTRTRTRTHTHTYTHTYTHTHTHNKIADLQLVHVGLLREYLHLEMSLRNIGPDFRQGLVSSTAALRDGLHSTPCSTCFQSLHSFNSLTHTHTRARACAFSHTLPPHLNCCGCTLLLLRPFTPPIVETRSGG